MTEKQLSASEKDLFRQRLHEKMSGECWVSLRGVEGELTFELNLDGQAVGLKPDTFLSRRVRCNPLPQVFELQKNTSGRYILHPLPPIVSPGDIPLAAAGSRTLVFLTENSGTQNKPSEKPVNPRTVSAGIENTRSSIQSATMTGAPPDALQKKYADLIASIQKEDLSEVWNLKNITPEQARVIVYASESARHPLNVALSIESLTPEVARELVKSRFGLMLNGVKSLDVQTAKELANCRGYISLDGLQVMTPAVANEFLKHTHGLELNGIRNINLPLATVFAKYKGDISLNGIEMLTADMVHLLNQPTRSVELKGIKDTLTGETINALAEAEKIYVERLAQPTHPSSQVRAIRRGQFGFVDEVKSLHPYVAEQLTEHYPEAFFGLRIEQLSPATARALARYTGALHFYNLESLTVQAANELATHHGELDFSRLRIDDIAVARALAKHTGILEIYSDLDSHIIREFTKMPNEYIGGYLASSIRELKEKEGDISLNETLTNEASHDYDELLLEEEPPEASPPLPENIDDDYVGYSVQIASGHTEGGSIKVSDLMRRVEQGTIPASYARDVLIRANERLYGKVDNLKMNEKERKAMQILQKYIDQLQGK